MTNALSLSALEPLMREARPRASARVADERRARSSSERASSCRPRPPRSRSGRRRCGLELRLDVDLDRLPDVPEPLAPLLQMQMSERPGSVREWRNWIAAFTQEGYRRPGSFSVLSVSVRPDEPARIALHLRPAAVEGRAATTRPTMRTHGPGPEARSGRAR